MAPELCSSCTGIKEDANQDSNTIFSLLTESDPIYDSPGNFDQQREDEEHASISQEFTGVKVPNPSEQEEVPYHPTPLGTSLPCNMVLALAVPSKSLSISLDSHGGTTLSWTEEQIENGTTEIAINLPSEETAVTIMNESIEGRHHIRFQVEEIWRE